MSDPGVVANGKLAGTDKEGRGTYPHVVAEASAGKAQQRRLDTERARFGQRDEDEPGQMQKGRTHEIPPIPADRFSNRHRVETICGKGRRRNPKKSIVYDESCKGLA